MFDPMNKETLAPVRRYLGMKQKELAEAVGVHINTINRIEKGQRQPSLKLWLKIAAVIQEKLKEKP